MGDFRGFGKDTLGFFRALKFHQDKAWFDQNRAIYDDQVVVPLAALLDDLTAAFGKARVPLRAEGKKSIFRIHRDVRFAKDKSPYKTHAGAVMTRSARKDDPGLLYVHIDPEGCFVAAGFHIPEPAALLRLRRAIAKDDGKAFLKLEAELTKGKLALSDGGQLSRVPRGFEALKGGPLADAVRRKSFIVEEPLAEKDLSNPKLPAKVADFATRAMPLLRFGWAALN